MNSGRRGTRSWKERRCRVRNWRGSRSRDAIRACRWRAERPRPAGRARRPSLHLSAVRFIRRSTRELHARQDFGFAQGVVARLGALIDALDYLVVRRKAAALQPEKNI